ncbi:MAG: dehydrogenase [Hyphomicrobiaceae bacterium]|nr:MAG: dehydrogenase [Hyphomicrobiaceae bacterium]
MTFKIGIARELLGPAGEPLFGKKVLDVLNVKGIEWEYLPAAERELSPETASRYDGLHINTARVTRASLARPDCRVKILARNGVGYDAVDTTAATERGIIVTNTPIAVRRPVAVATLTMLLALAGRLPQKQAVARGGDWTLNGRFMGLGLLGRTLGLVGAGGIGQEILRLAKPFFGRMIAADPYVKRDVVAQLGGELLPIERVMAEADFVVVMCLLNETTRGLINAGLLKLMKPTAYLLNMARGPIVDEGALIEALQARRIAGAALDVFEQEPTPASNPLLAMDNVIATPHSLCWTDECARDIATSALGGMVALSQGRRPAHVVNTEVLAKLRLGA